MQAHTHTLLCWMHVTQISKQQVQINYSCYFFKNHDWFYVTMASELICEMLKKLHYVGYINQCLYKFCIVNILVPIYQRLTNFCSINYLLFIIIIF